MPLGEDLDLRLSWWHPLMLILLHALLQRRGHHELLREMTREERRGLIRPRGRECYVWSGDGVARRQICTRLRGRDRSRSLRGRVASARSRTGGNRFNRRVGVHQRGRGPGSILRRGSSRWRRSSRRLLLLGHPGSLRVWKRSVAHGGGGFHATHVHVTILVGRGWSRAHRRHAPLYRKHEWTHGRGCHREILGRRHGGKHGRVQLLVHAVSSSLRLILREGGEYLPRGHADRDLIVPLNGLAFRTLQRRTKC